MKTMVRSAVEGTDMTFPILWASMCLATVPEGEISTLGPLSCVTVRNHMLIAIVTLDEVRGTPRVPGTTHNSFDLRQQPLSTVFQLSGILYNAA